MAAPVIVVEHRSPAIAQAQRHLLRRCSSSSNPQPSNITGLVLQPTTAIGNPSQSYRWEPTQSHTHTWPTAGNPRSHTLALGPPPGIHACCRQSPASFLKVI
uniref:Uncharacterized protein n=1 Tax=Nelumbo nucifera TaxID=4432 RepID=A0A822ZK68_NELNU|nr:TPA_asm: hypothetical protein HUJ06_002221 [Nelumbo nucifera]